MALGVDESAADGSWVEIKAMSRVEMAPFLRLVHLVDDGSNPLFSELAAWSAPPMELWQALQQPIGAAVEAKVAQTVADACKASLEVFPSADSLKDGAAPAGLFEEESASRVRQRLAARVLLGERCALEACSTSGRPR